MSSNIIHVRDLGPDGEAAVYVDSIDRGPKGEKGDTGDKGKTGEQGPRGIGVRGAYLTQEDHLVLDYTDDTEGDVGELPKVILKRVFKTNIDGTTNKIPLTVKVGTETKTVEIVPERVSYVLVNGVMYTEGFTFEDGCIVLPFEEGDIPVGKLEIFTSAIGQMNDSEGVVTSVNGRIGDIIINAEFEPLTDDEIVAIMAGEEANE